MSLALSRLTDREERNYDAPDRDLIGAIASRVAIAIDNSMLFETERQTALAFQKSLLPQAIPDLDGLEVACRYVPAKPLETQGQGIQTQVGGDWYDIIPLAAGRVGIVIGDVEGRGARAAAIMGQMRAALRAFAQDEKPPGRHHAQARRVVPVARARRRRRVAAGRRSAHGQLHLHDLRRVVAGADLRQRGPRRAAHDQRRAGQAAGVPAQGRPARACAARGSAGCPPTRSRRSSCRPGRSWSSTPTA